MCDSDKVTTEKVQEIKSSISKYVAEEFPVMNGLFVELEKALQDMIIKISENRFVEENY